MSTALSLPPIELMAAAAVELAEQAQQAADRPRLNAVNKAMLQLHDGTVPVPTIGGWLLESRTRGKVCWHRQLMVIIELTANEYMIPMLPSRATAEINELFS